MGRPFREQRKVDRARQASLPCPACGGDARTAMPLYPVDDGGITEQHTVPACAKGHRWLVGRTVVLRPSPRKEP